MITATAPGPITANYTVKLRKPHADQATFKASTAKRKVLRAGRRFGKTVIAAEIAVERFLAGQRIVYAAPVTEQIDAFWFEVCQALGELIQVGLYKKDETEHSIERLGTKNKIKAKTAWNYDTLRGGFADLLILDEYQLMNEDTWETAGQPILLDTDGDAIFIYTPPSLRSSGTSKAKDPRHAAKLFLKAKADTTGRWAAFSYSSHSNPHLSQVALAEITRDMSKGVYRQEILAEDDELSPSKLVYGMFNEAVCKVQRFEIPKTWPVYSGHDFGTANPAGLFFAQVKLPLPVGAPPYLRYNDLVAFREYLPGAGRSTAQHVDNFKELTKGYELALRMGGSHQEEEIRQGYGAQGWPILEPVLSKIKAQIDRVHGLMELNKVYVFNDLIFYLDELFNCLWKVDKEGKVTNEIDNEARYHLAAAARYILSYFIPETIYGGNFKGVDTMRRR